MAPGSRVQITVWLLAAGLIPSVLPGQGVIHREVSQGRADLPQGGQEVNEEAGFHAE